MFPQERTKMHHATIPATVNKQTSENLATNFGRPSAHPQNKTPITPSAKLDFTQLPITALANHIESTHHAVLHTELPRLNATLATLANRLGQEYPELIELWRIFSQIPRLLLPTIQTEQQSLFPAIRQLDSTCPPPSPSSPLDHTIRQLTHNHHAASDALQKIRELTDDFRSPSDPQGLCQTTLSAIAHLERDLLQYLHKEHEILFPKALEASAQ